MAQDFNSLPTIGGDLDSWYSSIANNINTPVLKGVYFYIQEDQMITPDQNPFYEEVWDYNGSMTYEGRLYQNMNLTYNVSSDQLLVWSSEMSKNGLKSLLINQSKIDSFTIHDHKFLNYRHAKIGDQGFYRKMMHGKHIICYSKVTKTGSLQGFDYEYEEQRKYWIKYKNSLTNYKRISSLYKIFPDFKKQIRNFLKENHFIFKDDKENRLQLILSYCDSLVKEE
ncbi:hypothetical protein [Ekhidna sp.]|uniref:hypothetical protein n=1 Tax=Ekhidna sp. TaxID=2608089 RepID=UPI00351889C4